MERFGGFSDPLTGRNPFVERGMDYVGLPVVWRALYGGIRSYLIPLVGIARLPLVLLVIVLWLPFQLLPRALGRRADALFARLLLFCVGTYTICCFTSTRANPHHAPFKAPARFHLACQLTTPLDVLVYTAVFRPGLIHIPYEDRLRKPLLAFFRMVFYRNRSLPSDLRDAERDRFARARYPCVYFPEGGPTNGTVLMKPAITINLQPPGAIVCAATSYKAVLGIPTTTRPYPTFFSFVNDIGVPIRAIDVQTATLNGTDSVMQGLSIAAGVPNGSLDAMARIEFLNKYIWKRDKED